MQGLPPGVHEGMARTAYLCRPAEEIEAMMPREFICRACDQPCVEGATEAAAIAKFGEMKIRERGEVCDPCFLKFMAEVTEVFLPETK